MMRCCIQGELKTFAAKPDDPVASQLLHGVKIAHAGLAVVMLMAIWLQSLKKPALDVRKAN
jgi:hypothetical protein